LIIGNLGLYPEIGRGGQATGSSEPVSKSSQIEGKSENRR
jgi:hypothetical protein